MKRHLSMYVKNDMFGGINLPPKTNKRYYSRIRAIRNQMFFERQKLKKSLIDQEALQEKVDEWKRENPTTSIYFRSKCSSSTDDNTEETSECEKSVKRKLKSSQKVFCLCIRSLGKNDYYYTIGTSWYSWMLHIEEHVTLCRYSF